MKIALSTFEFGLQNLMKYLDSEKSEGLLLERLSKNQGEVLDVSIQELVLAVRKSHVSRKQYLYSVSIVSLYGLLERYVDAVIAAHVNQLARIVNSYTHFPNAIVDRHILRSMELLKAIMEDKFRGKSIKPNQIVANLHSCLSGAGNFQINGEAFVIHRGNLTLTKIGEFLNDIGIDAYLRRVFFTPWITEWFKKSDPNFDATIVRDQAISGMFSPIDDLVERRNQVSHGNIDISDIPSVDMLKSMCEFVGRFVNGLHELLLQETARAYVGSSKAFSLAKPLTVFNNRIVCFDVSSGTFALGDLIIAASSDKLQPFRFGRLSAIQINKSTFSTVTISVATKIAFEVPFRAKQTYDYWIVKGDQYF